MTDKIKFHNLAILCKSCKNKWSLRIPISGNQIEAFATICDCGALIVGNYNFILHQQIIAQNNNFEEYHKSIYLTNGHYEILDLSENEIITLPSLSVE